ncbi:dipeptidase [Kordiimonas pumila]|uniref:Dipeptidase n=1 Tax=Kordiimonas pumila TaxID=2161677 RepID=A0ABV7DAB4_9PROT|nr:dipeptidase [Kordiimonas pumila]
MRTAKIWVSVLVIVVVLVIAERIIVPPIIEKSMNKIVDVSDYSVSPAADKLHSSLKIVDWHADSLLWSRDFLKRSDYGQVDLPRLQDGNINLQVMTTVTKSPEGQNYEENTGSSDSITKLAIAQGWPVRTWNSLLERALYQSDLLHTYVAKSKGQMVFVKNKADLAAHRNRDNGAIAVMLGTEGGHPFEGDIKNVDIMYNAGFRMVGLTHFFDNKLAGSLHGVSKAGLTDFGRAVVKRLDELNIIIDLAHSSEATAWEVLSLTTRPVVISHTGLKGYCDTARNYPDTLMKAIAEKGGLIAIGYWDAAVCDTSPTAIAGAIKYGIDLVGADHIALGSDWDGAVTALASDHISTITEALIQAGVPEADIRKVMGENSLKFLQTWLPD